MARKVFISFLGTNNYIETTYSFPNGMLSKPVRFIQEALIENECSKWTDNDKIIIFCTAGAEELNWVDNGQTSSQEEIEKIGLEHRLKDLLGIKFNSLVCKRSIPEGFSEEEIWDIFDRVYQELEDNDEIYFDVTHAFRSIPLFSTILFNYAHFMKHTNVVSIKYGAFEKLGPAFKVRKMPIEERVAPIIDLINLVSLQQCTDIANSFVKYGRIESIDKALTDSELKHKLQDINTSIENFDISLLTNNLTKIRDGSDIIKIKNNVKFVNRLPVPSPIKKIINKIDLELTDFEAKSTNKNIKAAIDWAIKYKMLTQAYTLGQEYIKIMLTEKLAEYNPYVDKSKSSRQRKYREYLSALCSIPQEDINQKRLKNDLLEYEDLTMQLLDLELIKQIRKPYALFSKNRNSLNHAKGDIVYEVLVDEFNELYNNCINLIK